MERSSGGGRVLKDGFPVGQGSKYPNPSLGISGHGDIVLAVSSIALHTWREGKVGVLWFGLVSLAVVLEVGGGQPPPSQWHQVGGGRLASLFCKGLRRTEGFLGTSTVL